MARKASKKRRKAHWKWGRPKRPPNIPAQSWPLVLGQTKWRRKGKLLLPIGEPPAVKWTWLFVPDLRNGKPQFTQAFATYGGVLTEGPQDNKRGGVGGDVPGGDRVAGAIVQRPEHGEKPC